MTDKLICFDKMDWKKPNEGVEQKIYSDGDKRLRLLKFKDDFIEQDWCLNAHVGFVIDGEMKIDFNGDVKSYKKGDGLWINKGEQSKHKVIIEKGKQIEIILFE